MTAMDLGRLVATASIDAAPFEAGEMKIRRALLDLNRLLNTTVSGVRELDLSMVAGADSATDLGAGLARATKASTDSTRATERSAEAEAKRNAGLARARELVASVAGEEARMQQALIRQAAATERVNEAEEQGTLTARQYLAAQSGLVGASRAVSSAQAAQAAAVVASARKIEEVGGRLKSAGRSISHSVTLPAVAAVAVSAKMAADFDSTMTRIQTQAGGSARDVRVLSAAVLGLAKTAQQGPEPLADSLYHLKSVGLDNVDAMKALRQASDLAAVGNSNVEDTTNALAGAWRTGIRGATSFHQAVKTLNAIVGAGNMSVTDLNAALGTSILPTAKTFGLTLKDVGSSLALFTDEGMDSASAATRLRMSISLLGAPSPAAVKQLKTIGITQNQLGVDMRKPNGLIVAIGDLKQHLDDSGLSATKQAALLSRAFGGGRSSSAILSMINNYQTLVGKQQQVNAGMQKYDQAVETQRKTPTAQFHMLAADLERTAIILGNDVLPDLVKLTHGADDVVTSFNNLSSTQKETLAWSVGILAALGPVLSLSGRLVTVGHGIGTFTTGTGNMFAKLTTDAEGMSTGVTRAMSGVTAALAGAGIGVAVGSLTRNSSDATKAIGALASAGAGAAIGFGVGGPLGAAIGGVAGGVTSLATSFVDAGTSAKDAGAEAKAAMLAQKQAANQLESSLEAVAAAYNKQYRMTVAQSLLKTNIGGQQRNVLAIGQTAGVTPRSIVSQVIGTGTPKALDMIAAKLRAAMLAGRITEPQMDAVSTAIGLVGNRAAGAERNVERIAHALGSGVVPTKDLGVGLTRLERATKGTGTALNTTSAAGLRNVDVIQQNVKRLNAATVEQLKHGDSVRKVASDYNTQIGTLRNNLAQMGFNSDALNTLIGGYAHVPKSVFTNLGQRGISTISPALVDLINKYDQAGKPVTTPLSADASKGRATAIGFERLINSLHQSNVPTVTANFDWAALNAYNAALAHVGSVQQQDYANKTKSFNGGAHAMGGTIPGTGNTDSYHALLTPGEEVIRKSPANKHRALLKAINAGTAIPMYAAGGTVPSGGITHHDAGKGNTDDYWTYAGQRYESRDAAVNAAHRAQTQTAQDRKAGFSSLIGDFRGLRGAAADTTSTSGLASQLKQVAADLAKAGLPSSFVASLHAEDARIIDAAKRRNVAAAHLKSATQALAAARQVRGQDIGTFRGAVTGAFDLTTAGQDADGNVTAGGLRAGQAQELTRVRAWSTGMTALIGKRIFPAAYLRELLGEGPDSLPTVRALLAMSGAGLAAFAADERSIASIGSSVAVAGANRLDNRSIATARQTRNDDIRALARENAALRADMQRLGDRIEKAGDHGVFPKEVRLITKHGDLYLAVEQSRRSGEKARGKVRA